MYLTGRKPLAAAVARYWRLPLVVKVSLAEAVCLLAFARFLIAWVPHQRWGWAMGRAGHESGTSVDSATSLRARDVGRVVRIAARWVPWNAVCLPQAIAAKHMLRRRKIDCTIYVGVRKAERPADAARTGGVELHAWLRVGQRVVTGAEARESFQALVWYG